MCADLLRGRCDFSHERGAPPQLPLVWKTVFKFIRMTSLVDGDVHCAAEAPSRLLYECSSSGRVFFDGRPFAPLFYFRRKINLASLRNIQMRYGSMVINTITAA